MAGLTKRKTPVIESVLYSYTGTDDDFNRFLKAVVQDFYTVCPARISQRDVVGSVEAVSYTHLDVYKRQPLKLVL